MLKSMKNMTHNIIVGTYLKLQVFLKRKSSGLKVKIPKF
jgi:primosomal replication protein N